MSRKYHGEVVSFNGDVYTVELWDGASNSGTGSTELNLSGIGFKLEYSGEGDTIYENPLRSSRAVGYFLIEDGVTETYFMDIAQQPENKFALQILKNGALWWVGRVLADQMQFTRSSYEGKYTVEITAVDALELIANFKVDSAWFTSNKIIPLELIASCLSLTGLDTYYSSTYANSSSLMYWDMCEHLHSSMIISAGSPLSNTQVSEYSFVENYDPFSDTRSLEYINCKQAIEQILISFGARMMLREGRYVIYQPNAYDTATIVNNIFDVNGTYVSRSTYTHAHTLDLNGRKQWESKPVKRYQRPLRKAEIGITRKNAKYVNKTAFNTTTIANTHTTVDDTYAIRCLINVETEASTTIYTHFILNYGYYALSGGIYYHWNGSNWVNHPATYWGVTPTIFPSLNNNIPSNYKLEVTLPILPSGCTEFGIIINSITGNIFPSGTTTMDFKGSITIQQPYSTTDPLEWEQRTIFLSENGNTAADKNSGMVELLPCYYNAGETDIYGIQVYNGSNYVYTGSWSVGWTANTGDLPQVLARLICGYYVNFVPTIRGNWIDNGDFEPLKSLSFDSYTWLFNSGTFNPRSDMWEGEWIGLIADYDLINDNGEGERVWGRDNDDIYDRLNYLETTVSRHEGAFAAGVNLSGLVTSSITINENTGTLAYLVDTSGGAITITLPTAVDNQAMITIKKVSSDGSNITIDGNGSETIDGETTKVINTQYQSYTIIASGGNWYIIN